jgi:DNA-binding NarL/FixJ family response regulator
MPGMSGAELMQKLREEIPGLKVLLLTMHLEQNTVKKMMQWEVNAYVLKNDDRTDFIQAVESILAGKKYYSSRVTEVLVDKDKAIQQISIGGFKLLDLTEREREVLGLIAEG